MPQDLKEEVKGEGYELTHHEQMLVGDILALNAMKHRGTIEGTHLLVLAAAIASADRILLVSKQDEG